MRPLYDRKYWQMPAADVLRELGSLKGLSQDEASRRLVKYGRNTIEERLRRSALKIFLAQLRTPLIYILIAAAIVSAFVADILDALIIITIVLANATLGFVLEHRSERAVEKLKRLVTFTAKVLRDGSRAQVDVAELVPGDIVLLEVGDRVPADIRLIEPEDLLADEAILTGESFPVHKSAPPLKKESPPVAELSNIALMGTTIVAGKGLGIVIGTGKKTYFGQTAALLEEAVEEGEFQKAVSHFSKSMVKIILATVVLVAILNLIVGHGLLTSALFGIALAVSLVPEALPVIVTITLSRGAVYLARKGVIVKRLAAVEDLGNVDVLCADKTGTLTEAKISVDRYFTAERKTDPALLGLALLCNSATVGKAITGNPIDVAIWEHARKTGFDVSKLDQWQKIEEVPFDYSRRRMSLAVRNKGKVFLIVKGGPESVMPLCTRVRLKGKDVPIGSHREQLEDMHNELANQGYREIALAIRPIAAKDHYSHSDEQALTFLGFMILTDPPRKDVRQTLETARRLGIALKILTGDNALVSVTVARQVGLKVADDQVYAGDQLEKISDSEEFRKVVERGVIFARINPEQKYRIVKTLRENNHVVAFLGDGVNDAPGLREADVGISVETGADVTKEVADVVLTRKSLHRIVDGVAEGRRIFSNIIKYILYTMAGNFGDLYTIALASPFLPFVPLLPTQVLLANLLTDAPLVAIATDNVESAELRRPRRWNVRALVRGGALFGAISSIFDLTLIYYMAGSTASQFQAALFLEIVLSEVVVLYSLRSSKFMFSAVRPSAPLAVAILVAIFAGFLFVIQPLADLFRFSPLSTGLLQLIAAVIVGYVVLTEVVKYFYYRAKPYERG